MPDQDFLTQIHLAEEQAEAMIAQAIEKGRLDQEAARLAAADKIAQTRRIAEEKAADRILKANQQAQMLLDQSQQSSLKEIEQIRSKAASQLTPAIQALQERIVSDRVSR